MYTVIFNDDSTLASSIEDSKWNTIDKPIKAVIYGINGAIVTLPNFEQYNHIVEKVLLEGKTYITKTIIMGSRGDKVKCCEYNFRTQKWLNYEKVLGKEYNNSSTTGWKKGNV